MGTVVTPEDSFTSAAGRQLFIFAVLAIGGITALMSAAYDGHAVPARVLLEGGASIDAANDDGDTALILAAGKGEEECVRVLLAAGAGTSVGGKSAASVAEINGRSELAAMIRLHENRSRRLCSPRGVSSPGKGLVETVEEQEGALAPL